MGICCPLSLIGSRCRTPRGLESRPGSSGETSTYNQPPDLSRARRGHLRGNQERLIRVAPDPVFPLFEGLDQHVAGLTVVAQHVLVLGHIAAAHVAADQADAQLGPTVT